MSAPQPPSVALRSLVYGGAVALDDPAETYHEASRLAPATALAQLPGIQLLSEEPALQQSVVRAARRHGHRPGVELGRSSRLRRRLDEALLRRRSSRAERVGSLSRPDLSALLGAGYRARARDGQSRRAVPSGGALYPLELYEIVFDVAGIDAGLYHYDPYRHRLARLAAPERTDLAAALSDPSAIEHAAVAVVLTAVFWRSRFKYGQRGYRFCLLEAGHVAQNLVLAAASLDLPALPLGGFYDRRLDALLGVDGVNESSLYVIAIGGA
jgi:SagB-type dehydrogenase family enzyme